MPSQEGVPSLLQLPHSFGAGGGSQLSTDGLDLLAAASQESAGWGGATAGAGVGGAGGGGGAGGSSATPGSLGLGFGSIGSAPGVAAQYLNFTPTPNEKEETTPPGRGGGGAER